MTCVQKELDKAFHNNVVLAEKAHGLSKDLDVARHRIRNHPALAALKQQQDIRDAMEAQCNAAIQKVSALSNLNLECHTWKRRVLAANDARGEDLARKEQVILANNLSHARRLWHTHGHNNRIPALLTGCL